ncbi:HD domain-containing protein [Asaia spathodeae]|uniref:HD domain-containing protein n=1 Tax=Asaia spathodeae TaxID=657016 RepID=A0ABX2P1F6_9PROT|nr:HD domain-containing protein [Asaia spathodeae]GBR13257.1 metal dependent phosphohydrolase [Asaia spathodeae NBRC 105894]
MNGLVRRAKIFATRAHASIGQKRKYDGQDYIVHPEAVALIVATAGGRPEAVAAAWLHDVVEDTPVTQAEIDAVFGSDVGSLVEMLTDVSRPEDGNRETRKAIDRAHSARASAEGQTIKLADLLDNARSIVRHDKDFAVTFLREMKQLMPLLTKGDHRLHRELGDLLDAWEKSRP